MYAKMLNAEHKMSQLLQHILQDVWDNEVIPDAWKRSTIIKLPARGYLSECINWRGTTLLSITSKVFCRIILQRITTSVNKLQLLVCVFVVFEKAFDSLHRPSLWKILQHHGISQKLVNIIQALYENFECRVIYNQVTEPF